MATSPIKLTDTTLRDAHQSLWATRMTIEDMRPVLNHIDRVGYWSLEVWGGATFDVCLRYLNEDPWERLSEIREQVRNTQLQMLLRGQNVVGYRNYPDDVLEAFVLRAADRGLDIFRIFDALNDARNLERAVEFVKRAGRHAQGTLCYAISPVHTLDYYVERAREQRDMGVDSICIKDMAGILAPSAAHDLVSALKSEIGLPVQLHCHASSGMAVASYLKAAEAGVDIIDTASAPVSFSTSQPAGESLAAVFAGGVRDPKLDLEQMEIVAKHFEKLTAGRCVEGTKVVDAMVIIHQIPGGMASNLLSQLREQKAEDRLAEVLDEVPRVREDLGYPPLVTPTSQIVGVQAVMNVLAGERYKLVPKEVKDYVRGLYGRSPAPVRESVVTKVLGKDRPIKGRPADRLDPAMPKVTKELSKDLVQKEEDYISYALFPEVSLRFFEWRKNPTAPPPVDKKPGVEKKPAAAEAPPVRPRPDEIDVATVRELIEALAAHDGNELEWDHHGKDRIVIRRGTPPVQSPPVVQTLPARATPEAVGPRTKAPEPEPERPPSRPEATPPPTAAPSRDRAETSAQTEEVASPMVGTFYLRPKPDAAPFVEVGDAVEPGQTFCIVEAMKLMNEIQAEKKCRIVEILSSDGDPVEYGQPLLIIEPL